MDIPAARAAMQAFNKAALEALPPIAETIEEHDIHIPTRDGWQSRTKIVCPKANVDAKRALYVHFYGGGFMVGEPEDMINVARAFAEEYGIVVALPSYRLVPEVKWPIPHQDAWDVVAWLSAHAEKELGANLKEGFLVGGASAGAMVAVAVGALAMFPDSEEAQETTTPKLAHPLTGQFLNTPMTVCEETVPVEYKSLWTAHEDNKNAEGLNTAALEMVLKVLQLTPSDFTSLWCSPVPELIKREPVNKFPIYMEHCQFDAMRDDVTVYAKVLESRGVRVKTQFFPEDNHAGWVLGGRPGIKGDFKSAGMAGMKWLLSTPE